MLEFAAKIPLAVDVMMTLVVVVMMTFVAVGT